MRLENYIHLRHILLYHFEKGWKAAESSRDLNELYGDGTKDGICYLTLHILQRKLPPTTTSIARLRTGC